MQSFGTCDHYVVDEDFDVITNMAVPGAEALPNYWVEAFEYCEELFDGVCPQLNLTFAATVGA